MASYFFFPRNFSLAPLALTNRYLNATNEFSERQSINKNKTQIQPLVNSSGIVEIWRQDFDFSRFGLFLSFFQIFLHYFIILSFISTNCTPLQHLEFLYCNNWQVFLNLKKKSKIHPIKMDLPLKKTIKLEFLFSKTVFTILWRIEWAIELKGGPLVKIF